MTLLRLIAVIFVSCGAVLHAGASLAQTYPVRPVTIVVPLPAGGGSDLLARLIATKLEQRLGKPFIVENKPGASNLIGVSAVLKAPRDGYTLLMGNSTSMAINVTIRKNLPYDPAADLIPLGVVAKIPFILTVNPSLPVKTVTELIVYAKANPGKLSFASSGVGSPHHLYMELFKTMTGTEMTHVPYRGSLPALNDLVAGHIPVMFVDFAPGVEMFKAGKVRPLGVSTKTRVPAHAGIPPIAEAGLPGFDAAAWQMLAAPAGTPPEAVARLHAALKAVLLLPAVRDHIEKGGMTTVETPSVEVLRAFVASEIARWGDVVKKAGLAGSN
jgi:tripartite-type tricarboxylate transporter receptor subunit TctC